MTLWLLAILLIGSFIIALIFAKAFSDIEDICLADKPNMREFNLLEQRLNEKIKDIEKYISSVRSDSNMNYHELKIHQDDLPRQIKFTREKIYELAEILGYEEKEYPSQPSKTKFEKVEK